MTVKIAMKLVCTRKMSVYPTEGPVDMVHSHQLTWYVA